MATAKLPTTAAGSGTQQSTQTPQSSVQAGNSFGGQSASSVQTGTAATDLTSQGGIPLKAANVSTVSLAGGGQGQTTTTGTATHHIHPALFGFSALLLVVAIILFWSASRSVKTTTN